MKNIITGTASRLIKTILLPVFLILVFMVSQIPHASPAAASTPGTLWAWGKNGWGEVGNGTNTDSYTPVQVSNLTGVTSISAGRRFTLAVKSDGTVWAWGDNGFGQLGTGDDNYGNPKPGSSIPIQVYCPPVIIGGNITSSGYLTDVVAVAAGWDHSMALTSYGTVLAWGSGQYGQLGNGDSSDSNIPVSVVNPSSTNLAMDSVVAIAAGGDFSLALKSDGTVWAWGWGYLGRLGNGTTSNSNLAVQVKDTTGGYLTDVIAISAGWSHSLALKKDGTVWAWGESTYGELGDGSFVTGYTNFKNRAVQVVGPNGGYLTDISGVSAGQLYSLALKDDGTVWAWGWNNGGRLGNPSIGVNQFDYTSTPLQVKGLDGLGYITDVTAISAGDSDTPHSLALKSDGTVCTWGFNNYWYNGSSSGSAAPVPVSELIGVTAVSAGFDHSVAVTGSAAGNTPIGSNVLVQPTDSTTGTTPMTLTLSRVDQSGTTTLTTSSVGPGVPATPDGFRLASSNYEVTTTAGTYYEITTTAVFAGNVMVCIKYDPTGITNEDQLKLLHYEISASNIGLVGLWIDVTTSHDITNHIICGCVTSLSAPPSLIITTQPVDQTVTEGNDATFTAAASGTPTPTVRWQVTTDGGSSWNDIPGAITTELTITSVTLSQNGYKYQAVFTNTAGSATTDAATLTVHAASFVITASADSGGLISPSGNVTVSYGADQAFTITPDSGYNISNVTVDGVSQGVITNYPFTNVTANHRISGTFFVSSVTANSTVENILGPETNHVIDASAVAQTTVTVNTNASCNITVEQYSGNPHPEAPLPANMLPRYNDIVVSDSSAIIWPMYVSQNYTDAEVTGLTESSLRMYYYKGTAWHQCSDTGVNTGANYVCANMTEDEVSGSPVVIGGTVPSSPPVTPAVPPSPPPSGGGGGGGGVVGEKRITSIFSITTKQFKLGEDVEALSYDNMVKVFLKMGTEVKNAQGSFVTSIIIEKLVSPPSAGTNAEIIGSVYDIGPSGATFDPPITITFSYDPNNLSGGDSEQSLALTWFDKNASEWKVIDDSVVETSKHDVTAHISHFTPYAIVHHQKPAPPAPTPAPTAPSPAPVPLAPTPPLPTLAPPAPAPASFTVSDLSVTPDEATPAEEVTVSALVTNTGGCEGVCSVVLKINDTEEARKEVTVGASGKEMVIFTTAKNILGSYTVNVNDKVGQFRVALLPPLPKPTSALPFQPSTNWWLFGGIAAGGIIIIMLLVYLFTWRRRST